MATKTVSKFKPSTEKKLALVKGDALPTADHGAFVMGAPKKRGKVLSRWPRIKPKDMPLGGRLIGKLVRIETCMIDEVVEGVTKKKATSVFEILPEGMEIGVGLFGATVIETSLQVSLKDGVFTSPFIGETISIERLEKTIPNKRGGRDAWNFIVEVF